MTMTMDELMKVLDMQEDILQLTHFTNADAWELGNDDPDGGKTARSTGWHHDPQKQRGSCIPVLR